MSLSGIPQWLLLGFINFSYVVAITQTPMRYHALGILLFIGVFGLSIRSIRNSLNTEGEGFVAITSFKNRLIKDVSRFVFPLAIVYLICVSLSATQGFLQLILWLITEVVLSIYAPTLTAYLFVTLLNRPNQ